MSQTLEATFDGRVFRPIEPVELKPDTQVELVVTVKHSSQKKSKSFLHTARSLKLEGPEDFSSRLDEFLYGGADLDE